MWGGDRLVMKYLMVDISGKVPKYDIALSEAIASCLSPKDGFALLAANINPKNIECKSKCLLSLVPKKFQNSENIFKRVVKALEGLYLVLYIFFKRPTVIHFQWLPFLEITSIECIFLDLIKKIVPKSKIILTVHNIYPHNSSEKKRINYKYRFAVVEKFFETFILHLHTSRSEFCKEFGISETRCKVIPHGIFEPKNVKITPKKRDEKLRIIMYGNQSYYKGTDILIDAIAMLPKDIQEKMGATIVGQTSASYLKILQEKSSGLEVKIIPKYVSDDVLHEMILKSDIIVFPYREISQSGALLLALFFERPIICSDLPSFRETLDGFDEGMFFESENAMSLSNLIKKIVDSSLDIVKQERPCVMLKERYLWKNVALMYIQDN